MPTVQIAGNREIRMKIKLWLLLVVGGVLSSTAFAQEKVRTHLKCHLQLQDKTDIIHHFVNTEKDNKRFIDMLTERSVFMSDGVSEQAISLVHECVETKDSFKSEEAITLEKNTPL